MTKPYKQWWNGPEGGDQSMEDSHWKFWKQIFLDIEEDSLEGKRVLDFGCSQGGLLRLMHERYDFLEGVGVDLAEESIQRANERRKNLPLKYFVTDNLNDFPDTFDFAISSAVIYLLSNLEDHARQMWSSLKNGGVYYATHPDYLSYPNSEQIVDYINEHASVPASLRGIDEIARTFESAGFSVQLKRMTPSYVTFSSEDTFFNQLQDKLEVEYCHRYIFRLTADKR